jgi:hypothetical protein
VTVKHAQHTTAPPPLAADKGQTTPEGEPNQIIKVGQAGLTKSTRFRVYRFTDGKCLTPQYSSKSSEITNEPGCSLSVDVFQIKSRSTGLC